MASLQDALNERKKLREVYNTIADCWSHLRATPWPEVVEFSKSIDKGVVLDIGCGNGRNMIPFLSKNIKCVGFDFSRKMIKEAKKFLAKKGFKTSLVVADVLELPFKENTFNAIIFSRSLHHIPTTQLRTETLKNVGKLLKPGGKMLLTVWRRYYPRFIGDYFTSLFDKKFEFGDVYKKWSYGGRVYKRYFHLYSQEELENEIYGAGLHVTKMRISEGNIISISERS